MDPGGQRAKTDRRVDRPDGHEYRGNRTNPKLQDHETTVANVTGTVVPGVRRDTRRRAGRTVAACGRASKKIMQRHSCLVVAVRHGRKGTAS